MVCVEDLPMDARAQTGLIPSMLEALERDNCPGLQYQALCVLSEIAFGACGPAVNIADTEAIPKLISFLTCESDLSTRAVLMLGNFALHPMSRRGEVTRGVATAILPYLRPQTPIRLLRTYVRIYSNFCSDEMDENLVGILPEVILNVHDLLDIDNVIFLDPDDKESPFIARDIIVDACTVLANVMLGPDEGIEAVQAVDGLTERLVAQLGHQTPKVQGAALSAVGNMLAGTDDQVDRCLETNCLQHIVTLLESSNSLLMAEASRAVCNIFAGTRDQIQKALDQDMLTPLRNILTNEDLECQKQAACAITNLCRHESPSLRAHVLSRRVLEPYCALLQANALTLAVEVLDGLYELIKAAERDGNIEHLCYMLDEFDVLDQIQLLQKSVVDEHCCKIVNMSATLRKHAREERFIVHDDEVFTAERLVQDLKSQHQETQVRAIGATYSMLSEDHPPVNALLEAGMLTALLRGLDKDARPEFQHLVLAVWTLFVVTAGSTKHKMAVIQSGAIDKLLALLANGDEIAGLASCSLGNIAPHGHAVRDAILSYLETETGIDELKNFLKTYCNLIRSFIEDSQDNSKEEKLVVMIDVKLLQAIPLVCELLHIEDQEILVEACQACTNIIGAVNILNQHETEVLPNVSKITSRLVDLLGHETYDVRKNALLAVSNMFGYTCTGYLDQDSHIDRCLERVISFLQSREPFLVETSAVTVCNMLNHTQSHIQRALEKDILSPLLKLLADGEPSCHKQAARAVSIICYNSSALQLRRVMRRGVLEPLCALLASPDQDVAKVVLEGLGLLLQNTDKDTNKFLCIKLDDIGVLGLLEHLLEQDVNEDLREKADAVRTTLRKKIHKEHVVIEDKKVLTLTDIVKELKCEDVARKIRAAHATCRLLSEENPAFSAVVQAGVIPSLVAALDGKDCGELQCAAASAILLISHGTHKHRVAIVNAGAIPKLIKLLDQRNATAELAALTLSHLTHRAPVTRDLVLAKGGVKALLPYLRPNTPLELLRGCVAAYKNLCTDIVSQSTIDQVSPGLLYVAQLLDIEDQVVLDFACGALGNLLTGLEEGIDAVQFVPGLLMRLVALLGHLSDDKKKAALSVVGNMFTGTDVQTERCLAVGCLEHITPLLQCSEPSLVELATQAMHNLLRHQCTIQRVLDQGVVVPLLDILANSEPNSHVQHNAVGALANIIALGTHEHKMAVVQCGAIPTLVNLLAHEPAVAGRAIAALGYIAEDNPGWRDLVTAQGAVPALLQHMRVDSPRDFLTSCAWVYWNLCKLDEDEPAEKVDLVLPALPYISELLRVEDERILELCCRALVSLTLTSDRIEAVQTVPALTSRLVALLGHPVIAVKIAATVAVAFMFRGTSAQADRCQDAGCLDHIVPLLWSTEPSLLEVAAVAARNIFRHTHSQIQRAIDKGILAPIIHVLANAEPNSPLQCSAAGALSNLASNGTPRHIQAAVDAGAILPLVAALSQAPETAELAANALANIAWLGSGTRFLALVCGAVQAMLTHLRTDSPQDLLNACVQAYRNFCGIDKDTPAGTLMFLLPALPHISELLTIGHEHIAVLENACQALVNLVKIHEGIEAVQATPALSARIIALIAHEAMPVKRAAVFATILMLSGTPPQVDRCLEAGCLDQMVLVLQCREASVVELAVRAIALVVCHSPAVLNEAIDQGVHATLINVLTTAEPNSCLQYYALGSLVAIIERSTNEQKQVITQAGAIPILVALLLQDVSLAEPAVVALSNIAEESPDLRHLVLTHGTVPAILPHLRPRVPFDLLKICVVALSYFCRYDEKYAKENLMLISPALPYISELLTTENEEVLEHTCWAIVSLIKTKEGIELVQAVPKLTPLLMVLLEHKEAQVKSVVIVAVMLMLSGTDAQVDRCLKANCVEHIVSYLQSRDLSLMEKAAEAVQNSIGTTHPHMQCFLCESVLTPLMTLLACPTKGQKVTIRAVSNLCRLATAAQRDQLIEAGLLGPYCALLASGQSEDLSKDVLDSLLELLQFAVNDDNLEPFCLKLMKMGILDQIKEFQEHEDLEIKEKATIIRACFFSTETTVENNSK